MSLLPSLFSGSHHLSPAQFLRDIERSYERMFREWPFNGGTGAELALDVEEQKDRYLVTADLPGVKKENVEVSFQDGMLTIQAKETKESEKSDKAYLMRERTSSCMMRSISLPFGNPAAEIGAELKDGTLTISIPKSEDRKSRKIAIK